MTRRKRILPQAQRDLARLERFLSSKSPDAAERAAYTLRQAVFTLDEYAERYPIIGGRAVRELSVTFGRDGYVVQYQIAGDEVLIARIYHSREFR